MNSVSKANRCSLELDEEWEFAIMKTTFNNTVVSPELKMFTDNLVEVLMVLISLDKVASGRLLPLISAIVINGYRSIRKGTKIKGKRTKPK